MKNRSLPAAVGTMFLLLCATATAGPAATGNAAVLWHDPCETLARWSADRQASLALETAPVHVHQGSRSIRITCERRPGMTDNGWGGWYNILVKVPPIPVQSGDRLRLWYKMGRFEPFYPPLYLHVLDDDGTIRQYQSRQKVESGKWTWLEFYLSGGTNLVEGADGILGRVIGIRFAFYYHWFKTYHDYVRWIDDIQIVRLHNAEKPTKNQERQIVAIKAAPSQPGWSVGFVPYREDIRLDGELSEWRAQTRLGTAGAKAVIRFESLVRWNGIEDHSAQFWGGWNEKGLTLATRVADDKIRCNNLTRRDFRDCDYWRIYFDQGREVFMRDENGGEERTSTARSFDRTDYVFAAIPTSPEKKPLVRYCPWRGYYHQINDEGHLFDVRSIQTRARVYRGGYDMELFFPVALMRGFKARGNHIMGFSAIWGDTDEATRKDELAWPPAKSPNYYLDFATFGELVLLSREGAGFTYRVSPNTPCRGAPWRVQLCGVMPATFTPTTFELDIAARNEAGKTIRTWNASLRLRATPTWWSLNLDTAGMPAGTYRLRPCLQAGKVVLTAPAWNVALAEKSRNDLVRELRRRIDALRNTSERLKRRIAVLDGGASYETAYLKNALATLELFIGLLPYDLDKHYYRRALRKVKELEIIAGEALVEAGDPNRWCGPWRKVPPEIRPDETSLTFSKGMFLHHGQPIYLIGVMGQIRYATDAIANLGFNSVAVDHGLNRILRKGLNHPEWPEADKKRFLTMGKALPAKGLYWGHTIPSLHYVPEWVKTDPVLSRGSGHFLPFAIELPRTRRLVEAYYKTFLPPLGGLRNPISLCLLNEPEYEAGSHEALELYRSWLHGRYKTIGELNRRWGTRYATFAAIPITRDAASIGARYDWLTFNRKLVTEFVADICQLAKQYDPLHRPVHVKCMSNLFNHYENEVYGGIDREAIGAVTDFVGYDGGFSPLYLDFIGSLSPGKPIYHSEGGGSPVAMWEGMIHGLDAITFWLWDSPWGAWGREPDYMLQQPAQLQAKGRTALDLQRLAPEIQAIAGVAHRVAILYSFASRALDYDNYVPAMKETHETLRWCQIPIGFVSEKQILTGKTAGLKLIIVPDARFVLDETVNALKAFAHSGGRVVLIGDALSRNPYGRPHEVTALRNAPGVIGIKRGSTAWKDAGRRLIWLDSCLTKAGVRRPIRVANGRGQLIPGLDVRSARFEGKRILFLCRCRESSDAPLEVHLQRAGPLRGIDLITHNPVKFPLQLRGQRSMLVVLDPDGLK